MTHLVALHEDTELVGDYAIERVLGAGGFGITYLASETKLARRVAIKEYFGSPTFQVGSLRSNLPATR